MRNELEYYNLLCNLKSQSQPITGLVAHYNFNNNILDSSGNGYDLNVNGAYSFANDRNGNANSAIILNNANNAYATIEELRSIPEFSVFGWIKHSNLFDSVPYIGLLVEGSFYTGVGVEDGRTFVYNYTPSYFVAGTSSLNNNWHHVGMTMSGTVGKLYLDGELIATGSLVQNTRNTNVFKIKPFIGGFDVYFDDVYTFNKELTQEEVTQIYNEI